jgi:two-component system osmolarity sensor histidine kinase EnvZ
MQPSPRRVGLATLYTRWLAGLFIALEGVTIASVLGFVMLPMAERSADDLAGLMVLSARTWAELPPQTRPAFEDELGPAHQIALRPNMPPAPDSGLRHGFYVRFLERAFERRVGHEVFFLREAAADGSDWLWVAVPAGTRSIGVGFAVSRLETNPLAVVVAALLAGTVLVGALAWWLALRIAQPVARFERAAAQLATGAQPDLLPETGPRELADLAQHFNRMAGQVRELSDARTTLFAGLSHDLRTPLARMRLALEMLTLKPEPALLQRLELDIGEMNRLIGQLLEIARGLHPEAGQTLDLCAWLQTRTQVHQSAAAAAGASLRVDCPGDLRATAAPEILARVLDNLLGNALRYAPGPIELVGQRVPNDVGEPVRVRIGVLDRGPGIPQDQLSAAFRPFHRIEGSASLVPGGFGLGLAIVQQLSHANGWTVSLQRRQGGGLAAWVELPVAA